MQIGGCSSDAAVAAVGTLPPRTRKKLSWQTPPPRVPLPATRTMTRGVLCMVHELYELWEELHEREQDDDLRSFLEKEVALVVEATEQPFHTDEQERLVYQQLGSCAVEVQRAILRIPAKDPSTLCRPMPHWRRGFYDDILDKARELSAVLGGGAGVGVFGEVGVRTGRRL
ncbi:hypothetical protein T484DRAFT_1755856 [Baffinella frigidus]|nr:hypothetical protein T484DRAFT_1755856 [Cryptophyta sp. CCMP2293]